MGRMICRRSSISVVFCTLIACILCFSNAAAQPACNCDTATNSICSTQGFRITLVSFSVDSNLGVSNWDYQVCNETGTGTGCDAPTDLSHVDLDLPDLGQCLTANQQIQLAQIGGFSSATLACGVSEKDPSCDIFGTDGVDFVAKCDVAGGSLDTGECVTMRLSIAGESPTLGPGAGSTVTKAGPECASDCILGPSCESCGGPPQEEACLTRTAGFWGTHPHITNLFLPQTVCGQPLTVVTDGTCNSATEAMCVSGGRELKMSPSYAQLVRQLTAAKLNIAATAANDGGCSADALGLIADCESLCGASEAIISGSGCIADLAAFNESLDTLVGTPAPFDNPGPANATYCRKANGNGIVIGKGSCQ